MTKRKTDDIQPILDKFAKLGEELSDILVERDNEIEGALAALAAGVHVLFLGPPGTAKSMLANKICEAIDDGNFFQWLLTKFTTPEELFGPYSLKGLENDEYRRVVKNKLPEATIAFLDEIFKANSAILNTLLTLINERKFHNNGGPSEVPLLSCFGASNELPKGEELGALYDRFILRYWITEIQDDNAFMKVMSGDAGEGDPSVRLTMEEISTLQDAVSEVTVPDDIISNLREVQLTLKGKGIVASDRRWKTAVKLMKAFALLRGRDAVSTDELEILADVLWAAPEDRKAIFETVSPLSNPFNLKAMEYLDAGREVYDNWVMDKDNDTVAMQAVQQIKEIIKQTEMELLDRPEDKTKKLRETKEKLSAYAKEIYKKIMEGA